MSICISSATWRSVLSVASRRLSCSVRYASASSESTVAVDGQHFRRDEKTNVTPSILSRVSAKLHQQSSHPLGILRSLIVSRFPSDGFEAISPTSPAVTIKKNFDDLGFPPDHPGRAATDSYYINSEYMLRTHTSAHEIEIFKNGHNRWLLAADVYRRDEIDRSHYPVFHQMEGSYVLPQDEIKAVMGKQNEVLEVQLQEALSDGKIIVHDETKGGSAENPWQQAHDGELAKIVDQSLKLHLNLLVINLFGPAVAMRNQMNKTEEILRIQWLDDAFPWTSPSYQMEVFFDGKWLEIFGCGVVKQDTLDKADMSHKMGWAFGLGLERIAMILFGIPDIRLFWSSDKRFLSQFAESQLSTFQPYSKYPPCYKDVSFWLPEQGGWHENLFCDVVRDVAGDLVADVRKIDEFDHPKTGRKSLCYRINYQSMDRNLENDEVNALQGQVIDAVVKEIGVELR